MFDNNLINNVKIYENNANLLYYIGNYPFIKGEKFLSFNEFNSLFHNELSENNLQYFEIDFNKKKEKGCRL